MIYLTLDTCVWLRLLNQGIHHEFSVFDELCFWIENGHLKHITTTNLLREWDRNKIKEIPRIISSVKGSRSAIHNVLKSNPALDSLYSPENVEKIILERAQRIDNILKNRSEEARESNAILQQAAELNLKCKAPNHSGDCFRDTVNILTLMNFTKENGYEGCIFSTVDTDFSVDSSKKHDLHPELTDLFEKAKLQFVYCDENPLGEKLIKGILRKVLPSYEHYVREKERQTKEKQLESEKLVAQVDENPDVDFLDNIKHIDLILRKKAPTSFEKSILRNLINRHESYRRYFLRKVGDGGMV